MALLVSTTAISVPSTFCSLHNDILCVREKAFLRSSQNCQQLVRHSMMRKALQVNTRRQMTSTLASATNGWEEPVSSSEYLPTAEFYKVEAIIRPWRVSHVATSLVNAGIRGVTVTDVRGFGSQGGSRERHAGSEFSEDSFVAKIKLEVVVTKDQVEVVVEAVIDQARTGEIGDGKIFISPVADVVRVRTGERGLVAERMKGGRAERHSANAC